MTWRVALGVTLLAGVALPSAWGGGGVSLSPSLVEEPAVRGPAGSVTVSNTSNEPVRVSVASRPWIQAPDGRVRPNPRRSLRTFLRVSPASFLLRPGARRSVALTLRRVPRAGSLYGGLEVVAAPPRSRRRGGVTVRARLVGSMRLNPVPARRRLRLRVGRARVDGGTLLVSVRNTGNTVEPVTGRVRVRSAAGTLDSGVRGQRILPGRVVRVRLVSVRGLPRGRHTAAVSLVQAGRVVTTARRQFSIR